VTLADDIVERCSSKYKFWTEVYEMLEKPFEYRAPTDAELREFIIRYAKKYK
jgi:hypothetical protein